MSMKSLILKAEPATTVRRINILTLN